MMSMPFAYGGLVVPGGEPEPWQMELREELSQIIYNYHDNEGALTSHSRFVDRLMLTFCQQRIKAVADEVAARLARQKAMDGGDRHVEF